MQHSLKELENWSKKWGFTFSINKAKAMIFSHKKFENHMNLKIDNHDTEFVNQFKFLGLIFNNRFTWNEHVNYCNKTTNLLKFVSGTKWGTNRSSLHKLYTALI